MLRVSNAYLTWMGLWLVVLAGVLVLLLQARRRARAAGRTMPRLLGVAWIVWLSLLTLTFCELAFALIYDTTDSFNQSNVSKRWFAEHVEPQLRTLVFSDGEGLRYRAVREFPKATPGAAHVCFVGDSFTFGHGVADLRHRCSDQVAVLWPEYCRAPLVVSNLSEPGKDLVWVNRLIDHLIEEGYRVDEFVYVLCLNDIESFDPENWKVYQRLSELNPRFFLLRDTYLLNFLYFRWVQWRTPEIRDYYGHVLRYYDGPPWEQMRRLLAATARRCREQGITFSVVVFPFLHRLGGQYPFAAVHRKIVAACREAGIPVVDLLPELRHHAGESLTVGPFDAHPNEVTHRLAAEAILKAFAERWCALAQAKTAESGSPAAGGRVRSGDRSDAGGNKSRGAGPRKPAGSTAGGSPSPR
ncbi:MAG: hypothetical protein D6725_15720 [Planctomycetota bacterium]|nr:MAG: hypothetical protein D6725_15720 [Planctomycetota bacterium]